MTDDHARDETAIRRGSPFQGTPVVPAELVGLDESARPIIAAQPEITADIGPGKMTALGAILASGTVAVFAAGCVVWFPPGGTIVSMLGCALAVLGLSSPKVKSAIAVLVLNLVLFGFCFVRTTGG